MSTSPFHIDEILDYIIETVNIYILSKYTEKDGPSSLRYGAGEVKRSLHHSQLFCKQCLRHNTSRIYQNFDF